MLLAAVLSDGSRLDESIELQADASAFSTGAWEAAELADPLSGADVIRRGGAGRVGSTNTRVRSAVPPAEPPCRPIAHLLTAAFLRHCPAVSHPGRRGVTSPV